jgi:hypothetical protein
LPYNKFNIIEGMQMVQNKKTGAGLALIAGTLAMSFCVPALALPEMQVGTRPPIVAPQSVDTAESAVTEPAEVDDQENAS